MGMVNKDFLRELVTAWQKAKGEEIRIDETRLAKQAEVAEKIYKTFLEAREGKLVILHGRTGSGKTEVLLAPFLYQPKTGEWFAARLYLVEPVHALLRQMRERVEVYGKQVGITVDEDHGEVTKPAFLYAAVATLTTVDSYAYGFLAKRVQTWAEEGHVTGRYTMPTGLQMTALTIFDEAHLIQDEVFLGPRILNKLLRGLVNAGALVVLASATLPRTLLDEITRGVKNVEELSLPPPSRSVEISYERGKTLTGNRVDCDRPTLVVVNTVARAQQLYEALRKRGECKYVYLLHSLMTRAHRERVYQDVKERNRERQGFVLVGTQTVEVGIDFAFDVLYTEVAPIDALIQRVGRIGRKGQNATAYIYDVETPHPYEAKLVNETMSVLSGVKSEDDLYRLIDSVYTPAVVQTLSKRGEALYLPLLEYLNELHLFAYPPEYDVYIRPSTYIDLYLIRGSEEGDRVRISVPLTEDQAKLSRMGLIRGLIERAREKGCQMGFYNRGSLELSSKNDTTPDGVLRRGHLALKCDGWSGIYDDELGLVVEAVQAEEPPKRRGRKRK